VSDLPDDIPYDPDNPPSDLPDLPPGYVWGVKVTAEAEVVKATEQEEH
jgi:hypothetical protein